MTDCDEVLGSIEGLWPPLRQGIQEQDETKKVNTYCAQNCETHMKMKAIRKVIHVSFALITRKNA